MESKPGLSSLLIVDDEKHTREGLRRALQGRFEVYVAADYEAAVAILESESIDVVLTDLKLGGKGGMEVLQRCLKLPRPPLCYMMTAYGSVETAVEAMRRGAMDYVTKPVNLDKLEMMLVRAMRGRQAERENTQLRQELNRNHGLERLIGKSEVMERVCDTIRQVADTRATVLVQGESGTGKELVAQAIHGLSSRRERPFVAVHCAALSPQLLESELFGHEKGSFTGAMERRLGRFEEADGGTVFLDEIGEIDEATQVKLLRVLGERSFERVGGNKRIEVDLRLVAASNKDLEQLMRAGRFREDLFYRINVVRIDLPALRERREDIPLLAETFLREYGRENGKEGLRFSAASGELLRSYDWPGNVRELRTAVEHGVVLCRGAEIEPGDLPPRVAGAAQVETPGGGGFTLESLEKSAILKVLQETGDNKSKAAQRLGISRRTLHRKLKEYAIAPRHV